MPTPSDYLPLALENNYTLWFFGGCKNPVRVRTRRALHVNEQNAEVEMARDHSVSEVVGPQAVVLADKRPFTPDVGLQLNNRCYRSAGSQ
jgi:hypothetical protein